MANCLRQNFRHHSERCYPQCWKVPKILDSYRSYPAVLIGRLGVNHSFQGQGLNVGSQLMEILKYWFVDENNKAACRYMLVDAYNVESTIHYYLKNGFKPLYKTEQSEKDAFGILDEDVLRSRVMFFDLKMITA